MEIKKRAESFEEGLRSIKGGCPKVYLNNLKLSTSETNELSEELESNTELCVLDLTRSRVRNVRQLSHALEMNVVLEELYLGRNSVGAAGTVLLAQSLKSNRTLQRLSLAENGISDIGCQALREMLLENSTLSWLKLDGNGIGRDECRMLVNVLKKDNRVVFYLNLDDNDLDDFIEEKLAQYLSANKELKREKEKQRKAALEDALKSGTAMAEFRRCRLFMVGKGGVGKTATVRSLLNKPFDPERISTVGAKITEARVVANKGWNESNDRRDHSLLHALRITAGENLVLERESEVNERKLLKQKHQESKQKKNKEVSEAERIRIARMEALARRGNTQGAGRSGRPVISKQEEDSLFSQLEVDAVMAKENFTRKRRNETLSLCLNVWDFGGQHVFEASIHHMFFSQLGVYLLVFDLRSVRDEQDYLLFWFNSIKLHATDAPVFFIGTFANELKKMSELEEVEEVLRSLLKNRLDGVVRNQEQGLSFFPIDNSTSAGVSKMADAVTNKISELDFVHLMVSLRWTKCLDEINAIKDGRDAESVAAAEKKRLLKQKEEEERLREERLLERNNQPREEIDEDERIVQEMLRAEGRPINQNINNENVHEEEDAMPIPVNAMVANELNNEHFNNPPRRPRRAAPVDPRWGGVGVRVGDQRPPDAATVVDPRRARVQQQRLEALGVVVPKNRGTREGPKKKMLRRDWLSLKEVRKAAEGVDIVSMEELDRMLYLFHELGMLVHFTSTAALRNIVTLQPQWLVDAISRVIRDKDLHKYEDDDAIQVSGLATDVNLMFNQGLVSRDLLEHLWKDTRQYHFLLDVMRHTMLLSDWSFTRETCFIVPSLLQRATDDVSTAVKANASACEFDFSATFLPSGVFERLICLAVAYSSGNADTTEPVLSKSSCKIWLSSGAVTYIETSEQSIRCFIVDQEFATTTLHAFRTMLRKVKDEVMLGLQWVTRVRTNESWIEYSEAQKLKLKPWFAQDGKSSNTNTEFSSFLDNF